MLSVNVLDKEGGYQNEGDFGSNDLSSEHEDSTKRVGCPAPLDFGQSHVKLGR